MLLKIVAILAVLFLVYLIFFKKGREKEVGQKGKKPDVISDEMVECPSCGTFVSQNEAILSNGKFYCSKECLNNK